MTVEKAFTRRSLAGAVPAAVLAATVPALASERPDAELLALREPYKRTFAAMVQIGKPHTKAEDAYYALKRRYPERSDNWLRERSGLVEAEAAWEDAVDANGAVIEQITACQARTMEGLGFKAKVSLDESHINSDLVASIIDDILAIAGGADA